MQMIERVARALWEAQYPSGTSWDDWAEHVSRNPDSFDGRDTCRKLARAAIEAMREPTPSMQAAGVRAGGNAYEWPGDGIVFSARGFVAGNDRRRPS